MSAFSGSRSASEEADLLLNEIAQNFACKIITVRDDSGPNPPGGASVFFFYFFLYK